MRFKGCRAKINAHGRSQISGLIVNKENQSELITIAHDGQIKVWDKENLSLMRMFRIKTGYLTSLINFQKGFLVGTGKGEIFKFTQELAIQWSMKVHSDCVTDIIETQQFLISISYDGKVSFMSLQSLRIVKQLELNSALSKIIQIDNFLYISSNPGYKINLATLEIQEIQRNEQIIFYKGKIFASSYEKGISMIKSSNNSAHIPCTYMLPFKQYIIAISEQQIGLLKLIQNPEVSKFQSTSTDENHSELYYKLYRIKQFQEGYQIRTGIIDNDKSIIVAGEDGFIYKFEWQ